MASCWKGIRWRDDAADGWPTAVGGSGEAPPPGGGVPPPPGINAMEPTGVQVALTVQGLGQPMVKSFLLGGT